MVIVECDHLNYLISKILVLKLCAEEFAVQASDVRYCDVLRALHLAGAGVSTSTEAELVHLCNHRLSTLGTLDLTLRKESE